MSTSLHNPNTLLQQEKSEKSEFYKRSIAVYLSIIIIIIIIINVKSLIVYP